MRKGQTRPKSSCGRAPGNLPPIVGQMELCERVERSRRERRQLHEIGLVLLGEVTLEPIGGLDKTIVRAVRSDEGDSQPAAHRRVFVDLVAEVPPLLVGAELL